MTDNIFLKCDANMNQISNGSGVLEGYSFSAKDLFDLKGHIKSNGHKRALDVIQPSQYTSPSLLSLMNAGGKLLGLTNCDEFFYSLTGLESTFKQPNNWINKKFVTGGSSSGAAASVGFDLVDFALGSDTGGSIRVPASFCGLFGFRPTHGRVSSAGMTELAPSLDTLGWLTKKPDLLSKVGSILLNNFSREKKEIKRVLLIKDLFSLCTNEISCTSLIWTKRLEKNFDVKMVELKNIDFRNVITDFQIIQGWEAKNGIVKFIKKHGFKLRKNIQERINFADSITENEFKKANINRNNFKEEINAILEKDYLAIFPTTPMPALNKKTINSELSLFRKKIHHFTCIAGMTGRPQISIPLDLKIPKPFGISVLGGLNEDEQIISFVKKLYTD